MSRRMLPLILLVAAVLFGLLAWWLLQAEAPGQGDLIPDDDSVAVVDDAGDAPAADADDGASAYERAWVLKGHGTVIGTLLEYGTERPLGQVRVVLEAGVPGPGAQFESVTAADGSFVFRGIPNFEDWRFVGHVDLPLAPARTAGIAVVEGRLTDLGVLYATPEFGVPGVVVDVEGQPVAGARVRAVRAVERNRMDLMRIIREVPQPHPTVDETTTDTDGRFRLDKVLPGTYEIEVTHPGYRVTAERGVVVNPDSETRELRIVLERGFVLRGRVIRKGDGPLAGLRVGAIPQPEGFDEVLDMFEKTFAITDESGEFELHGLGGGQWVVSVLSEGEPYHLVTDVTVPRDDWIEILMDGDSSVSGRVTDGDGAPIKGAQVYVTNLMQDAPMIGYDETDEDGRYAIRNLKSGPVQLFMVQAEGFGTFPEDIMGALMGRKSDLVLKPGPNTRDVVLGNGGVVRGFVLEEETEEPVAGATVSLVTPAAMFGGSKTGTTAADGSFEIRGAQVGPALLIASKDGWMQPGVTPQSITQAAMGMMMSRGAPDKGEGMSISVGEDGAVIERTLHLTRGAMISGTVVTPEGEPVAGARVRVEFASESGGFMELLTPFVPLGEPRLTGADGTFSVVSPSSGQKVVVTARSQGWLDGRSAEIDTTDDGKGGVKVTLRRGAVLRGVVTGADGQPLDGATVRYAKMEDGNDWGRRWRLRQVRPHLTDAKGEFRINNVETGRLVVQIDHPEMLSMSREGLEATEGGDLELNAALEAGAVLNGLVTGPDGRPVAGARVDVEFEGELPEGADKYASIEDLTTGEDGTFRVKGVQPGSYSAEAEADGFADSDRVTGETGGPVLEVRLKAALGITGVVRYRSGKPVSGARVTARLKEGDDFNWVSNTQTNADGYFDLDDLPANLYSLQVSTGWGFDGGINLVPTTVDDVAAGTQDLLIEVDEGLVIEGRILDAEGEPVREAWVSANQVGEGGANASSMAMGGAFSLKGLAEGEYRITVNAQNVGQKTVTAKAGDKDVVIRFGQGGVLVGRVTRNDGTPAAGGWVTVTGPAGSGSGQVEEDGTFRITELEAGTYTVTAWLGVDGTAHTGSAEGVEVRNGAETRGVEVVLEAADRNESGE